MYSSNDFVGHIKINGIVETERVSVFISDNYEVSFSNAAAQGLRKKNLYLHPFNTRMLREGRSDVMKSGFSYVIRGTNVGAYLEGPLGHPGDGEYDRRSVKEFLIQSQYKPSQLTVRVEGTTESGVSGFVGQYERFNQPLDPWRFEVVFQVPRSEMKAFFGFTDHNYQFFEEVLDGCA